MNGNVGTQILGAEVNHFLGVDPAAYRPRRDNVIADSIAQLGRHVVLTAELLHRVDGVVVAVCVGV